MRHDLFAAMLGTAIVISTPAHAQSATTFTYQGHLTEAGIPADGLYEFEVRLLDNLSVQIGLTETPIATVTEGVFTMDLDFGPAAFDGSQRFLEISVRSVMDGGAFTTLSPNHPVTSTPIAQFALEGNEGPAGTDGLDGAPGAQGPQGEQGLQGSAGNDGLDGAPGSQGPQGEQGLQGTQGLQGNPGTDGNDGTPGAEGAQGPQGNPGAPGNDGLDGADGSTGPQGPQGPQGIQGNTGLIGPQGNPGDSHWTLSGSNTYFENGNVSIGSASTPNPLTVSTSSEFRTIVATNSLNAGTAGLFEATGTSNGTALKGESFSTSGNSTGGFFSAASTDGRGVLGKATATTGETYGGYFTSDSNQGYGVRGAADSTTGDTAGGLFLSRSTSGKAVSGSALATSGETYGGYFVSRSNQGYGVRGAASANSGDTAGGLFVSSSASGKGVYGIASAQTGETYGGYFTSEGDTGAGVYGKSNTIGGHFETATSGADGIYAESKSTIGSGKGARLITSGNIGRAVFAEAIHTTGANYAGYLESSSSSGTGLFAVTTSNTGITYAVKAQVSSSSGYAGYFIGGKNYFGGNVGIGTQSPTSQLHISVPAATDALRVQSNGITRIRVNANGGVALGGNSTVIGADDVYIAGQLGIGTNSPTFDLSVNGTAAKIGGGSWAVYSDQRLKQNIQPMTGSLNLISALRPVNFEYESEDHFSYTPGVQRGFIAQEVAKVIPQWVHTADDGYLYLDQTGYEALIIDALQELRAEKDAEIQQLQSRIDRLERMMLMLTAKN